MNSCDIILTMDMDRLIYHHYVLNKSLGHMPCRGDENRRFSYHE